MILEIDPTTGAVHLLSSSPLDLDVGDMLAPVFTPDGRYLYVPLLIGSGSKIAAFSIDATTGALSPVPGSPYPMSTISGATPWAGAAVVDATGKFLYVADDYSLQVVHPCCVYGFAIDPASGALKPLPGSPFNVGGGAGKMVVSGGFLVTGVGQSSSPGTCALKVFSIDSAGALTAVHILSAGSSCGNLVAHSSLPYVYDGEGYESQTGSSITGYSLDQTTGALTPIGTAHVPAETMGGLDLTH
jgi:6-phosphogluconolactonase (cycloisomerase 2 family)